MGKYIKETVVNQIEISDLDLIVVDEMFGKNPSGHTYDWVNIPHNFYWVENDVISIEAIQKTMDELKMLGANYVRICPHSDHHGYYFSGIKLEVMDENEIKNFEKEKLQKEIIYRQTILSNNTTKNIELKNSIKDLKNKLENL